MSRLALAVVVIATMTGCSGGDHKTPLHSVAEVRSVFAGNAVELRTSGAREEATWAIFAVEGAKMVDIWVFRTEEEARSTVAAFDSTTNIAPNDLLLRSSNVVVASVAYGKRIEDDAIRKNLKEAISQLNG
jgi:hypothetical protein